MCLCLALDYSPPVNSPHCGKGAIAGENAFGVPREEPATPAGRSLQVNLDPACGAANSWPGVPEPFAIARHPAEGAGLFVAKLQSPGL